LILKFKTWPCVLKLLSQLVLELKTLKIDFEIEKFRNWFWNQKLWTAFKIKIFLLDFKLNMWTLIFFSTTGRFFIDVNVLVQMNFQAARFSLSFRHEDLRKNFNGTFEFLFKFAVPDSVSIWKFPIDFQIENMPFIIKLKVSSFF
jgi:hypothetical protein